MVSLADLRARNVTPVWQEAVAVVQELIQTVKATTGSAELLPDLEHIALIPNGDVVALPGSERPDNPVQHAVVILKLLLDGTACPPELTNFLEKNAKPATAAASVAEFSRSLAFFERPGRRADIEGLVGRATQVETQRRADRELEMLKARAAETLVMETPLAPPTPRLEPASRRVIPIVVGLLLVVGFGAAWLLTRGGSSTAARVETVAASESPAAEAPGPASDTPQPPGQTAGATESSPNAPPARAATPSAVSEDAAAPAGGANPAEAESSLLRRAATAVSNVVGVAARAITGRREVIVRAPAEPPSPAPVVRRSRRVARSVPPTASTVAAPVAPEVPLSSLPPASEIAKPALPSGSAEEGPLFTPEPVAIYTSADSGVLPPIIVRPVLPKEPPADVPPEQVGTIEVVVDENGDVLNVKLISPANRFRERMLVSAAKMWKFRPAYKDGRAVRYRTYVRLTI